MAKRETVHKRIVQKIFEGLVSYAAVYLLAPKLLTILSPLQAQLNANAINAGQTPPNAGANAAANKLISIIPS